MDTHNKLSLGDKVFARSNEPEPLVVGFIKEFFTCNGKWHYPVIVITDGERDYNVLGHVRAYDRELHETLKELQPIEQWNYLVRNSQIPEKYGVKYRTF